MVEEETGVRLSYGDWVVYVEPHIVVNAQRLVERSSPVEREKLMVSINASLEEQAEQLSKAGKVKFLDKGSLGDFVGDLVLRHVLMS